MESGYVINVCLYLGYTLGLQLCFGIYATIKLFSSANVLQCCSKLLSINTSRAHFDYILNFRVYFQSIVLLLFVAHYRLQTNVVNHYLLEAPGPRPAKMIWAPQSQVTRAGAEVLASG